MAWTINLILEASLWSGLFLLLINPTNGETDVGDIGRDVYADAALDTNHLRTRREAIGVECHETGKFYRNPAEKDRNCYTYYFCLGKTVYEYSCVGGLMFDITEQICNFEAQVKNCAIGEETTSPRPKLSTIEPLCQEGELACAAGQCIDRRLFCDGYNDCGDGSDEAYCSAQEDPNAAPPCDAKNCTLPDCFCSSDASIAPKYSTEIKSIPQMIMLTFDDAINVMNMDHYKKLFLENRTNTNGCQIKGTFYVSHEYSDYKMVETMWKAGHEIASHSISHRQPEKWWQNATVEELRDEFEGERVILSRFANIPMSEIKGIRVPFLQVGWNNQFYMMRESGFLYDSSMVAPGNAPIWPYTLDFRMSHKCVGNNQKCPTRSHPGVWEVPMNQLKTHDGYWCAMIDNCPTVGNRDRVYQFLKSNFQRHYESNRAPMGLFFHSQWFMDKENLAALYRFIDEMVPLNDVWFVTAWQIIEWMRAPASVSELNSYAPWQCKNPNDIRASLPAACSVPNSCRLHNKDVEGERYMGTCNTCPAQFPWLKNPMGQDY